jgi:hypothetical protein
MNVSRHAVARYRQRVAPLLSSEEACDELQDLIAHAEHQVEPPAWAVPGRAQQAHDERKMPEIAKAAPSKPRARVAAKAESYLVIDDELCLPVTKGWVLTVITKNVLALPPAARSNARSLDELEAESRDAERQRYETKARRDLARGLVKFRRRQARTDAGSVDMAALAG